MAAKIKHAYYYYTYSDGTVKCVGIIKFKTPGSYEDPDEWLNDILSAIRDKDKSVLFPFTYNLTLSRV